MLTCVGRKQKRQPEGWRFRWKSKILLMVSIVLNWLTSMMSAYYRDIGELDDIQFGNQHGNVRHVEAVAGSSGSAKGHLIVAKRPIRAFF
ncbi:hypothetical protein [Massilia sp. TN1-12]|uniref:hypothetical protein n=1 Tax=Massilia paldalensis TaxID=3377675 RepID=UPI00384AF3B6